MYKYFAEQTDEITHYISKAKNPKAIPAAIENVRGMTSIITSAGNVSLTSSHFTFLKLLRKVAATNINVGTVAKLGIEANKGSKKDITNLRQIKLTLFETLPKII